MKFGRYAGGAVKEFWHIHKCSLFKQLNDDQLARLERRARLKEFPIGSSIYLPSDVADGALLLVEGRIRLCSITADGKQSIMGYVDPGELFGELALIESGQREERAEAALKSTVVLLPGDELRQLMEESAKLALGVTKLIGLRRKRIERRVRNLLYRSNREKISHLLLELAEQYGRNTDEGVLLNIKLSHQDLASMIGATRETVTTTLGEMQLDGLLKLSRQTIVLRNIRSFAASLGAEVPTINDR